MSMCPIHYPTSWFPTAFIFPTTSTSGPQNAGASRQSQQLAGRTVLYLEKWARIIDSGSWIQWQDANWNWRKSFAIYHHPVRDSCTKEFIHQEVQTLVDKGVIVEVPPTQVDEGFY